MVRVYTLNKTKYDKDNEMLITKGSANITRDSHSQIITTAMIDGREVLYDMCSISLNHIKRKHFKHVGDGTIHSIDGVRQSGTEIYSFYVYGESHPAYSNYKRYRTNHNTNIR